MRSVFEMEKQQDGEGWMHAVRRLTVHNAQSEQADEPWKLREGRKGARRGGPVPRNCMRDNDRQRDKEKV